MANITNQSAVKFVLYSQSIYETVEGVKQFTSAWTEAASTYNDCIVLLQQDNRIYANGTYYGITDAERTALINATSKISAIEGKLGSYTSITTTLVGIIEKLRAWADGGAIEGGDPAGTPAIWSTESGVLQNVTNVKDAIAALATAVNSLNAHTWVVVAKPNDAKKFATSVEQGTDGAISVTYEDAVASDILITGYTGAQGINIGTPSGAEGAQGTVQDAITNIGDALNTNKAGIAANAAAIGILNGDNTTNGSVAKAVKDATEALIGSEGIKAGAQGAWAANEARTLDSLRTIIDNVNTALNTLTDSGAVAQNVAKINQIIAELQNGTGDIATDQLVNTLVDKLSTLLAYANSYASDGTANGAQGYYRVGAAGAEGTEYVQTLQGIIDAIETDIALAQAAAQAAGAQGIAQLDASVASAGIQGLTGAQGVQSATGVDAANQVGVVINEVDGKLTSVSVLTNDIASAAGVQGINQRLTEAENQLKWIVV